jgi:hypothetical protein
MSLHSQWYTNHNLQCKEAYYNKYISDSDNRPTAAWNIVKTLTGNKNNHKEISHININNILTDNCQLIVNLFNTYFLTITDKIVIYLNIEMVFHKI